MKRPLRTLIAMVLLIPVMLLLWLGFTQSGLRWAYGQAEAWLPGELTITTLEGRLLGTITARGIEYLQEGALISADQATLEWRPGALLAAHADISRLHIQALQIVLPDREETSAPPTAAPVLPEINLPWRMALEEMVIDGVSVRQNEQSFELAQIRLSASTLFNRVDIEELSVNADGYNLTLQGVLWPSGEYRHRLQVHWQAELPSRALIKGQGLLAGNLQTTHITQQLSGPLQLSLEGELYQLLQQFHWQTRVEVTAFDAAQLHSDWPALGGRATLQGRGDLTTATLSGTLQGVSPEQGPFDAEFELQRLADHTIHIDQLMLHSPLSETRLHAQGQWRPEGDMALALRWQKLRWPLRDGAWFESANGTGSFRGNLDHYSFDISSDRPWPQAPPSHWVARGEGDRNGVEFHSLRVTALDGEANATGRLTWSPLLSWRAEASAEQLDPAGLWPQWPGRLKVKLDSSGRYENGRLLVEGDITELKGTLRDHPVSLRSRLSWRDDGLDLHRFNLHSGTSQVSAGGRVGEEMKLEWSINTTDLGELYPRAGGQLRASGQLSGAPQAPLLHASFNGKGLTLPGYGIGAIDGSATLDLHHWQQIDIKMAAQALSINGYAVQSLKVVGNSQRLQAQAVAEGGGAQIELRGKASSEGWRGRIEQIDINSQRFAHWQLEAPATLAISEQRVALAPLCWRNRKEARLCASLQREGLIWKSQLQGERLPLRLFRHWLPAELRLEGVADATAELQFQPPEQLLGELRIELPAGVVNYTLLEGAHERREYRSGRIEVSLTPQGVEASSGLTMLNDDRFQGRLALPGARVLALQQQTQPLQASAQLNIHDLGIIGAILPEVQDLRGEVELNLTAAGTLARPALKGQAHLRNGALRIPRLGLSIEQLTMQGHSDGLESVDFHLDARSGDGQLAIQGQTTLDRDAGWPTGLSIKGKEFEVSRIPEARVVISPDLQLKLQRRTIDVRGEVHIPYARLQPKDLTTAATVSRDAVIVGSEQGAEEQWSIASSVRLNLGERVHFYGFGFEGRFGGTLLLAERPGQVTRATGEISIPEGRYRAYGQWLDVEHGRLLYTGGPLANPGLDLRAVRHIGEVSAGIKVRGTVHQPQLELFSIPAMGQTDTLSYLLLGGPMENASGEEGAMMAKAALALGLSGGDRIARILGDRFGLDEMRVESSESGDQASLVMGRYLSPRLYISYGVGLLEAINTLTVRYKISDKWQLKAESGEYQGADLLYTIER